MALVLKDRVKETTSTAGTGSITLLGPVQGYQGFSSIGDGNTTYYTIAGTSEWEVGVGTYSGGVLSRDTVLSSSASGAKVAFSSGIKDVFCTYAAGKAFSTDSLPNLPVVSATSTASPNDTINVASLTANTTSVSGDLALDPKGAGALITAIPDNTSTGGNKRGQSAVDLQLSRTSAGQVASGLYSGILSGYRNTSSGQSAVVAGGQQNTASGNWASVGGGNVNSSNANYATVSGGQNNISSAANAFIGGGYLNGASGSYSLVAGGRDNAAAALSSSVVGGEANSINASASYASIGGGRTNSASATGLYGTIAGGRSNATNANYAAIGGGQGNTASGSHSTIAGGQSNTASGINSGVLSGLSNTASAAYSGVGNGTSNVASGVSSFVTGSSNTASASFSVALGGGNNTADANNSVVIGGQFGTTRGLDGFFVVPASSAPIDTKAGVTQGGVLLLGAQTTNATPTVLRSNSNAAGATNQLALANNSAIYVFGYVIANVTAAGDSRSWIIAVTIKRGANAGTTTIVGSSIAPQHADAGASAWDVTVAADTVNGCLAVTVTGQASTTIRWVCRLETVEVAY